MSVVLTYGASGTQGWPVARQLVERGEDVRLLVRNPDAVRQLEAGGAELAIGDLLDADSLREAHRDVDRVFLHLPLQYDFELHKAYGANAIAAAREAGAELIVLNTTAHVIDGTDVEVYNVRRHTLDQLADSGVPAVVFRPTFYMEIFLGPWIMPGIQEQGVIAFPLPNDFPMSWVSAEEVGAYCVAALDRPDLAGQSFDIGGPEALTGDEIAARVSALRGRTITWVTIDPSDYEQALVPLFGGAVAAAVADQVRYIIANNIGPVDMTPTRDELGVEAISFEAWAKLQAWTS